jgi:hypothetical protein
MMNPEVTVAIAVAAAVAAQCFVSIGATVHTERLTAALAAVVVYKQNQYNSSSGSSKHACCNIVLTESCSTMIEVHL